MYSFLIFDADGTLFDFQRAEAAALKLTCRSFGIGTYNEDTHLPLYREVNGIIWEEFENEKITAAQLKAERFKRFFSRLNLTHDPKEFSLQYLENLSNQGLLLEGAEKFLTDIEGSYTCALLTNGLTSVQFPRYNNSILPRFFSHIVVSEDVGVAKPNPKIFDIVFREAGWKDKASTLMIGDSLSSDIRGGINFGVDTCWYNPEKRKKNEDIDPTYEVSSFAQLYALLQPS